MSSRRPLKLTGPDEYGCMQILSWGLTYIHRSQSGQEYETKHTHTRSFNPLISPPSYHKLYTFFPLTPSMAHHHRENMTKKQQTKWMTKEEGWTFVPFKKDKQQQRLAKEHPQAKKEKAEVRKISSSKVPQLYEELWPLPSATINKEDAEMEKAREASLKSFKKEEEAEMRVIEQAIAASLELPKKKSAKKVQVRSRGKARGGTNTKTMSGSPSLPK